MEILGCPGGRERICGWDGQGERDNLVVGKEKKAAGRPYMSIPSHTMWGLLLLFRLRRTSRDPVVWGMFFGIESE